MQSALQMPDLHAPSRPRRSRVDPDHHDQPAQHADQAVPSTCSTTPATTGDANSEITALSNTRFLVDERDGRPSSRSPAKTLYEADINGATDVSNLEINGLSPEAFVGADATNAALTALTTAGVHVAQRQPYLQVGTLVSQLDPTGAFFGHDKVEGVATTDAGQTLYLSNDDDFGIDYIGNCGDAAPCPEADGTWAVHQKVIPATGQEDSGEILEVDTTKLPGRAQDRRR